MFYKMKIYYTFLLAVFVISCVQADLEVKVNPDTSVDPKNTPTLKSKDNPNVKTDGLGLAADSKVVQSVKDSKDKVSGSDKGVEYKKLKEGSGEKKLISSGKENIQRKDKDDVDKKKKPDKGSELVDSTKALEVASQTVRKEGSHVEECDSSNSCKVDRIGLVACLRVPGNESPELLLLVQNKGKGPLSVKISAPEFVKLEKKEIQLKENEDNKMKVTIKKAGATNVIVLTAGDDNCTLDYRDIGIALNLIKETIPTTGSTSSTNVFRRTPLIAFVVFGALVVVASVWMIMSYRKRHFNTSDVKYQKLDTALPVSGGAKLEFQSNDGWDNSWGDDWDDEEAPKTPLMPLTPSLSSKGLASRRLNKDVWKD